VLFSHHNVNQDTYYFTTAWNADAPSDQISASPVAMSWGTSARINFAQPLADPGNNTIHLFVTETNQWQLYARSEDWGASFAAQPPASPHQPWLDFGATFTGGLGSFGFCNYRQLDSDPTKCRVLFAAGYESARAVRYCEINLATGDISKSDGTVLGNLRTLANLPLSAKEADSPFEIVYQAPAGKCLNYVTDLLGGTNPEGCFGVYDLTNPDTASDYYWCQRTSTSPTWIVEHIVNKGPRFTTAPSTGYHSEQQMLSAGNVLLGRAPNPTGGFVNGMWTGDTWNIEKWTRSSPGVWTSTVLQSDPAQPLVRVFPVTGSGPRSYVYSRFLTYDTYTDFNGELIVV
jgi:hypothetical protein